MVVSLLQGSCIYPWHDTSECKQNSLCPFQTYIGKGTALNVEKVKSLSMQVRTFPYIRGVLIKHDYEWLAISRFSTEKGWETEQLWHEVADTKTALHDIIDAQEDVGFWQLINECEERIT